MTADMQSPKRKKKYNLPKLAKLTSVTDVKSDGKGIPHKMM